MTHLRRDMLRWLGAASLLPLVGCNEDGGSAIDANPGDTGPITSGYVATLQVGVTV